MLMSIFMSDIVDLAAVLAFRLSCCLQTQYKKRVDFTPSAETKHTNECHLRNGSVWYATGEPKGKHCASRLHLKITVVECGSIHA